MLATFIELLLPKSEFRRYIKMVVGLLIVLVLMSSVQQFLQLVPGSSPQLFGSEFVYGEGQPALSEAEKGIFEDNVRQELKLRLEAEVERVALKATDRFTVKAQVNFKEGESFNPEIAAIAVFLRVGEAGTGEGDIKPVVIDVSESRPSEGSADVKAKYGEDVERIKEEVAAHFEISKEQVDVSVSDE